MTMTLQKSNLKAAILLPLALVLIILLAVFIYSYSDAEKEFTDEYVSSTFQSTTRAFDSYLQADTETLSASLYLLMQDDALRRALAAQDRDALLQRAEPLFRQLRDRHQITHFYFSGPDRVNLLRVHQPDRHGDTIDRITTKQAEQTGKPASGLELGPLGTFTLRVVFPWYDKGRLIGYVELGEEIEHLIHQVHELTGNDVYLTIDKQHLQQKDWEAGMQLLGRASEWNRLPDSVITLQTTKTGGASILNLLAQGSRQHTGAIPLQQDGRILRARFVPMRDAGNRKVGNLLLARDITPLFQHHRRDLLLTGGFTLGLGGLLFWLLWLIIRRVEKGIVSSTTALEESEKRFHALVESSSDWIWEIDAGMRYVYVSPKCREILGYEPHEIIGKTPFDLMPAEEAARISASFSAIAATRQPFANMENRNLHKDGRIVVLETSGVPILDADGTLRGYRGMDRDITARKHADEMYKKSMQRLALHFEQTPLAVIEWDTDFKVLDWNPSAEKVFGYTRAEALGRSASDLILPKSFKELAAQIGLDLLAGVGGYRSTNENITKGGRTIFCEWYNTPLVDDNGHVLGVISLALDITAQKLAEQRISYLAYYDELTGLPNRTLFKDHLAQACIEADRHKRPVALMFLDMDDFKVINDTLGHEAGNLLLQAAASRLKNCFRSGDTLARFGGDEFAVVLANLGHADDVGLVAQNVINTLKQPFAIPGNQLCITFSMGITLYPFDGNDTETLLRNADSAMYHAKGKGRNSYQFYSAEMTRRAQAHLTLQIGLRRAFEQGELLLHYQPQVEIWTGRITGVEALLRWHDPEKGMISPADFIPIAEENGLIIPIGEWVLRTACAQMRAWQDQGFPDISVAVNLSSRQFKQDRFAQRVGKIINEAGIDPRCLELELTESVLMEDAKSVSEILAEFKQAGISIAIDDFGTGYSSLSYLKRFPIDKLKIDQSFVRDVTVDANDASLVKAIIAMARALNLKTIAEGVETADELEFLRAEGCEEAQGYLIGRPMPAEKISELLQEKISI